MRNDDINYFYNLFRTDKSAIKRIFSEALNRGGDYCDIYFEKRISNNIGLEDNRVNKASTTLDIGVGIRVLNGDQTGYSYTEDLSFQSIMEAAKTASNIANDSKKIEPVKVNILKSKNYYPVPSGWQDIPLNKKMSYLLKINDKVFSLDKRIVKTSIIFSDESSEILIASSDGKISFDTRPMTVISVSCTAEEKGKKESNGFSVAFRNNFDFLTEEELKRIAEESVKRTVILFDSVKPEGGEMEIVLSAGSSGILLHEAIGHGLEADFNRKGISAFSDKKGKMISDKTVSIIDDGTLKNDRGSINTDDENNPTEKTFLVNEGKLVGYLHDRISSGFYGVNPTGNGRRESFRFPPMPRMRNTYMLPGQHKREDIIKSVKSGILAETFSNGQVLIGAGDFTFYVKTGFLIENGRLTQPIKDINIIGNGPSVLNKIVMVADDFKFAEGGWTCGKNGQGVPVSMGLPTIKVSSITVGGS